MLSSQLVTRFPCLLGSPSIVPGQVRLLRSILIEHGEANLARIDLAKTTAGTFELKNGK